MTTSAQADRLRKCPKCKGQGFVFNSRETVAGRKRRCQCSECNYRWTTIETIMTDDRAAKILEAGRVKGLATRRGVKVPPAKEAEWRFLKRKNLTNAEAAAALGLRYTGPTK